MTTIPNNDNSNTTVLKQNKTEELNFDEKDQSDSGKFKFILSILKKVIGVGDILNLRISLPSQVLDPIPNLEYFHWLDRPDYFAAINEPEDPTERFLGVVRYSLTRFVKYLNNKLVKPYNSILGEQFLCRFDTTLPNSTKPVIVNMLFGTNVLKPVVTAQGHDHLSAKFTGTTVKISPGNLARGMYIKLSKRDNEEYHVTHCTAYIHGFLSGKLGISLSDRVVISCPVTGLRAIYEFKPEPWIGKNRYIVEGKVFRFQPSYNEGTTEADLPPPSFKLSSIGNDALVASINGCWKEKVFVEVKGSEQEVLIDMSSLEPLPKIIKPRDQMGPLESHNVWDEVTTNLVNKEFGRATKAKIALEDRQRELARQRAESDTPWEPAYFYTKSGEEHKPYFKDNVNPKY